MKKPVAFLSLLLIIIACNDEVKTPMNTTYKVDSKIASEVDNNTVLKDNTEMGSMEIKRFENDSLVQETFSSDKIVPFWIMKEKTPASVEITGMVGLFDASGFQLSLTKTDYKLIYFSGADFRIYKMHKEDTVLTPEISLECKKRSLILKEYPSLEKGEEIAGIVEFKTPEYWTVSKGVEKKVRIEGKAYFKTKIK